MPGIGVSPNAVERCARFARRARVLEGIIESGIPAGLPEEDLDLVVARHLLGHLADPARALVRCASLAQVRRVPPVLSPNTASPGRRLKGGDWSGGRDATHISLLDPPSRLT